MVIACGNFYRVSRQSISQFDNECDFLTRHFYKTAYYWRVASRAFVRLRERRALSIIRDGDERGKARLRKPDSVRMWTLNSFVAPAIIVKINE